MKKKLVFLMGFGLAVMAGMVWGQETPTENPITGSDSLEVEKLKLQIEELKLENQRLELQIKTIQLGTPQETPETKIISKEEKKDDKRVAADMAAKAEVLAKANAMDEHLVVLDFSNGEIWYKGIRNKLNDFLPFCEDQKWKVNSQFIKYDINGDSLSRYRHQNMYLDRYAMQSRGVFVFEIPASSDDFKFVTPEGVQADSSFGDFRNNFQTQYFNFDKEDKQNNFRILRFKHSPDFLTFDDVLEFWFDKEDHLQKVKWGMLDKK
jgi:hypothetical protein